ncbi:MAG: TetR/AcrR family transcriptional regulator [Deltaproteobacteria bacterium]|nr:TetR/AcrR family transcriptional regulator [Deltaproteobacteria bacterium]
MSPPPNPSQPPARASQPNLAKRGDKRVVTDKREAILDAALELFVERGFFGTAVPEIADRAGVGAGTIYRYFESKEALVNAIYREQKTHWGKLVLADFPVAAPTREQFRLLWMRMAQWATENPKAFIFMELHHHQRYLDDQSRALEERMLGLFTAVVVSAQARRELKAGPPQLLMGIVMGAFVGVIRSCVEIDQSLDSADWKLAEQMLWEALRA